MWRGVEVTESLGMNWKETVFYCSVTRNSVKARWDGNGNILKWCLCYVDWTQSGFCLLNRIYNLKLPLACTVVDSNWVEFAVRRLFCVCVPFPVLERLTENVYRGMFFCPGYHRPDMSSLCSFSPIDIVFTKQKCAQQFILVMLGFWGKTCWSLGENVPLTYGFLSRIRENIP